MPEVDELQREVLKGVLAGRVAVHIASPLPAGDASFAIRDSLELQCVPAGSGRMYDAVRGWLSEFC